MTTPEELSAEIDSVSTLLKARVATSDAAVTQRIAKSQARSIAAKIRNLNAITPNQAMDLQDAISACPFDVSDMETAMAAVDHLLAVTADAAATTGTGPGHKSQTLTTPQFYVPASKVAKLKDPATTHDEGMTIFIELYRRLGIKSASEQTKKWAIALMLCYETQRTQRWPSYHRIYNDGQDFQAALKVPAGPAASEYGLMTYPTKPDELPTDIYNKAYDADDPPMCTDLPRLNVIAATHIPCRATSKLLRGEQADIASARPAQGRSPTISTDSVVTQLGQILQKALGNGGNGGNPNIRITDEGEQLAIRRRDLLSFTPRPRRYALDNAGAPGAAPPFAEDNAERDAAGGAPGAAPAGGTGAAATGVPGAAPAGGTGAVPASVPGATPKAALAAAGEPNKGGKSRETVEAHEEAALKALLNRDKKKGHGWQDWTSETSKERKGESVRWTDTERENEESAGGEGGTTNEEDTDGPSDEEGRPNEEDTEGPPDEEGRPNEGGEEGEALNAFSSCELK